MKIQKIGRVWYNGKKKISSYELYCVFGQSVNFREKFGKVYPSQFTIEHVKEYVKEKKNKTGIFKPRKTVWRETFYLD